MQFTLHNTCTAYFTQYSVLWRAVPHTSYLSQAPQAVPVEKNSAMWRNFRLNAEIVPFKCGENLSHGEISPHEKCGDKSVNIMCTIFDVLSHFMLFCCKIFLLCDLRCFVAKSVLSWFTRFGVEKNRAKNCDCGEKRTNMRYVPNQRPFRLSFVAPNQH